MAKLSSDGQYVTVEKGDSLWAIAKKYLGDSSKNGYQKLAKINGNMTSPYYIYPNQKIYLYSKPSSTSTSTNSNKVTIKSFGLVSNVDNTLFVTWNWSKSHTDHYLVEWSYYTGDGVWFIGASDSNTVDSNNTAASRQSTYSIPANATQVRVRIKPVSKTYTKNKKETKYWTASWSAYKKHSDNGILTTPAAPTVEMNKFKLTASLENISIDGATTIQFQIYKNDGKSVYKTGKASITSTKTASWSYTVGAGGKYKVRCRALSSKYSSDWSLFSNEVTTIPLAPSGITELKALSETSVYVDWDHVSNTDSYEVQYTTKKIYFDSASNEIQSTTIDAKITNHAEITGLESGQEYFFRVRAINAQGESGWTAIKSIILGKAPSAPTTWSSTTTCITGEDLVLYWVHNSEDNSSQTYAELELTINGVKETKEIKNSTDEDEKDKTSSYKIKTSSYTEGTKIKWRVRTAGITKKYGDWSIQRVVDVYAPPTLELNVTDIKGNEINDLESFPFYVYALPGPNTQTPIGYHLSVVANQSYETVDNVGNTKIVSKGEEVYSQYFDISRALNVELMPSDIDLETGVEYTLTCIVSMNSGLTAEASHEFFVAWSEEVYIPNAEIGYDKETYVTHIKPYCTEYTVVYHVVEYRNGKYVMTDELIDDNELDGVFTETGEEVLVGKNSSGAVKLYCGVYADENGESITPKYYIVHYDSTTGIYTKTDTKISIKSITSVLTTSGEQVLKGLISDGRDVYCCLAEDTEYIDDVTLSVYRREYDGRFVEIATGLNNKKHTYVTDPHPALDYARYRIVAVSEKTGAVSYYDPPGYPINEDGVIIQWDEEWTAFDTTETSETEEPAWAGSLLRLLYNVDVSDNNAPDVASVAYIGRSHPVTYYGTQLGLTSTWNMEVPITDKETLYGLRRLMIYMGDVYVREPSGSGYWANVKVSFNQKHSALTIPVTLNITRVEGGA